MEAIESFQKHVWLVVRGTFKRISPPGQGVGLLDENIVVRGSESVVCILLIQGGSGVEEKLNRGNADYSPSHKQVSVEKSVLILGPFWWPFSLSFKGYSGQMQVERKVTTFMRTGYLISSS